MQTTIDELIIKHLEGTITPEESGQLEAFKAQSEENRQLVEDLTNPRHLLEAIKRSRKLDVDEGWQKTLEELPRPRISWRRYFMIAAVALVAFSLAWLLIKKTPAEKPPVVKVDNHPSGSLINILKTARGESRNLQLSDGSSIWLNGASAVQYPGSFSGPERAVSLLEGEVHCKISENAAKPFRVRIRDLEVEVKGTQFDISAYKDDSFVRTTLISGKVKVKAGNDSLSLHPGEQAIWAPGKKMRKIKVDSAGARYEGWQENKFKWVKADLRTVLNDIAHWYGYKLIYKKEIPSYPYDVTIDRSQTLNNVLKIIKTYNRVNFKVDSTTITVDR